LNIRRVGKFPIILAISFFPTSQGWADTWQQAGSAKISTEFVNNPALSPTNPQTVERVLFEPGYGLKGKFGENELTTGLAFQIARSSNETLSPQRNSPNAFLDWLRESEMGEFGASAKYAEIVPTDISPDTTGVIPVVSTRVSRFSSVKWSKMLSERSILSANGSYERVNYASSNYISYSTRSESLMFSYALGEGSIPFLTMMHSDYAPTDNSSPSSFTNMLLAGWNWKASDYLDGSLQMGKTRVNNDELSTQGGALVHYTGQRTQLTLNLNSQVLPSGLGGYTSVVQVNGNWSYDLNERTKTAIDLGWIKNHLVTDVIYRSSGAWIQYELDSFWNLKTYYLHNFLSGEGISSASSYILGFSLVYTHSDF
jgi:hypothetical protein